MAFVFGTLEAKSIVGPLDLGSSDCLHLKLMAGGQEVKQGPGAQHLIIACIWAMVPVGGEQEGRQAPELFPFERLLLEFCRQSSALHWKSTVIMEGD